MRSTAKDRPILMHARSIRGTLAGRKTQTRRIVKGPRAWVEKYPICRPDMMADSWSVWWHGPQFPTVGVSQDCPYGKPRTRLWVKESHYLFGLWTKSIDGRWRFGNYGHEALFEAPRDLQVRRQADVKGWYRRSSLFMPRWASRLTLEITDIRVERVQDISEEDAIAEGIVLANDSVIHADEPIERYSARAQFKQLWDDTNGKGAWDRNEWVWVISFRRVQ